MFGRGILDVATGTSLSGVALAGATLAIAKKRFRWRRSVYTRSPIRGRSISAGPVGGAVAVWGTLVQEPPTSDLRVGPAVQTARPGAYHGSPATRSAFAPEKACRGAASPALASASWVARSPSTFGFPLGLPCRGARSSAPRAATMPRRRQWPAGSAAPAPNLDPSCLGRAGDRALGMDEEVLLTTWGQSARAPWPKPGARRGRDSSAQADAVGGPASSERMRGMLRKDMDCIGNFIERWRGRGVVVLRGAAFDAPGHARRWTRAARPPRSNQLPMRKALRDASRSCPAAR